MRFFYTYILQSLKDKKLYTGSTIDLRRRLTMHNEGKIYSTKNRRPFRLVYYEACINEHDARRREIYLKTSWGKRYIKSRIKFNLTGTNPLDKINNFYLTG